MEQQSRERAPGRNGRETDGCRTICALSRAGASKEREGAAPGKARAPCPHRPYAPAAITFHIPFCL